MNASVVGSKLPVWQTLGRAYAFVFLNLGRLFLLAYIPFFLVIIGLVVFGLAADWDRPQGALIGGTLFFVSGLIASTIVAVAWHRFVLVGWESHASGPRVRFGEREVRYFGLLCLALSPFLVALAVIVSLLDSSPRLAVRILTLCVVAIGLSPRVALLLPAAALEETLSLKWSWSQTRGMWLRLSVLLLLPTLPYFGILSAPAWVPGGGVALFVTWLVPFLALHFVMWVAVLASVLSLAFAHVTGRTTSPSLARKGRLTHAEDDVLTLHVDRDFGWLYIVMLSIVVVTLPLAVWELWGWTGVITAIVPWLSGTRAVVWRAMVLIEESFAEMDRETLRMRGRFGELTVYLKDIREVKLRRAFGANYVDVTFDDLDRALAHTFLVQTHVPTLPYIALGVLYGLLRHVDVVTFVLSIVKGDVSSAYLGRQVDLYKEGAEQYLKDMSRDNFKKYGFHWTIQPIFRNLSNTELAREIDRRSQAARTTSARARAET